LAEPASVLGGAAKTAQMAAAARTVRRHMIDAARTVSSRGAQRPREAPRGGKHRRVCKSRFQEYK
jgi:hypothetical protein